MEVRHSYEFYVAFCWLGAGPTVIWRQFYLLFAFSVIIVDQKTAAAVANLKPSQRNTGRIAV